MELVLASIERVAVANADGIASRMVAVLRHLLAIEDDAATHGGNYRIGYSTESSPSPGYAGNDSEVAGIAIGRVSDEGGVLHIYIPHFGIINIERLSIHETGDGILDHWIFDGVDMAFDDLIGGLEGPDVAAEKLWSVDEMGGR
jgi:hypothetical protein